MLPPIQTLHSVVSDVNEHLKDESQLWPFPIYGHDKLYWHGDQHAFQPIFNQFEGHNNLRQGTRVIRTAKNKSSFLFQWQHKQ